MDPPHRQIIVFYANVPAKLPYCSSIPPFDISKTKPPLIFRSVDLLPLHITIFHSYSLTTPHKVSTNIIDLSNNMR